MYHVLFIVVFVAVVAVVFVNYAVFPPHHYPGSFKTEDPGCTWRLINGTVQVPCGKCFACQSNRRRDWHMRIKYEMLHCLQSFTVTLTYDNLHLPELQYFVDDDPLFRSSEDISKVQGFCIILLI